MTATEHEIGTIIACFIAVVVIGMMFACCSGDGDKKEENVICYLCGATMIDYEFRSRHRMMCAERNKALLDSMPTSSVSLIMPKTTLN